MKTLLTILILMWILTACAPPTPAPTDQPSIIIEQPTRVRNEMTPAQIAALTHLSTALNLPAEQITLVSTETVTWPDGCLGVQRPDVMCTQALVDGFKIVFEANGREYELHTDETGNAVVIASGLNVNSSIEDVLIKQLAENMGLDEENITVLSNESTEFPDACLGVVMQDVMCAEVITPGRIVVLESDGIEYEYHVSEDGTRIQPASFALTWSRDGGIAGFCDRLTVFLSGEVYGNQCKAQPNGSMGTLADLLSVAEREQFNKWVAEYDSMTLDASDPKSVADGMSLVIVLYGRGKDKPDEDAKSELFTWSQNLFQRLYN